MRRRRALDRTVEERQLAEESLSQQAETLRAGLTGLSEDDRALLDKGRVFTGAGQAVESWRDGATTFREEAGNLQSTISSYLAGLEPPPEEPEGDILKVAYDEYRGLLSDAKASLDALVKRADDITAAPEKMGADSPWRQWSEKMAEFRGAYDAAVQRSSAHREKMEQLKAIEEQLTAHVRETARVKEELRSLASAEESHRAEQEAWKKLIEERDDVLDAQCAKLTQDSGGAIRTCVKRYSDATEFVNTLRNALSGSRVPGNKVEGLGESIATAEQAGDQWEAALVELERLAEFEPERDGAERRPDAPVLSAAGLTPSNLDGVGRSLKPEDWLALSLTPIKSVPVFEYRAREQEYIPFQNASAGQQATALLKTLLNQPGPPLIIDQPEEDLDNPVMLEIVERVWQAKQKRQLIFASHNANLVVNGDAELVAWCDHRTAGDQSRGTIAGEGAIDVDDVRDAIKKIMEGGEAAFNLRKEKYGF